MPRIALLVSWAFLLGVSVSAAEPPRLFPYPRPLPEPSADRLLRWRGFNLQYKFNVNSRPTPDRVADEDFRLIASLGFNFVRLPLDYRCWITGNDWEHLFLSGPGEGEWKQVVHRPEWNTYQNVYDRDYTFAVPAGVTRLELRNVDGDWLTLSSLAVETGAQRWTLNTLDTWGLKQQGAVEFDPRRGDQALHAASNLDRAWLRGKTYAPWREAQGSGMGVMVGEFGAYKFTPHAVVLHWMEDLLATYQQAGWGWALWEFRGGFGVLDSARSDAAYEPWEGHQLDRAMLELLQRY